MNRGITEIDKNKDHSFLSKNPLNIEIERILNTEIREKSIDLSMLDCPVELEQTCAYNLNMPYQAAFLEVKKKDKQEHYVQVFAKGNRVLYSTQDNTVVKKNRSEDLLWCLNFQFFCYVTEIEMGQNHQSITFFKINLEEQNSKGVQIKIVSIPNDFSVEQIHISNSKVYLSNKRLLYSLDLKENKTLYDFKDQRRACTIPKNEIYQVFTYADSEDLYGIIVDEEFKDAVNPIKIRPAFFTEEDYSEQELVSFPYNIHQLEMRVVQDRVVCALVRIDHHYVRTGRIYTFSEDQTGYALVRKDQKESNAKHQDIDQYVLGFENGYFKKYQHEYGVSENLQARFIKSDLKSNKSVSGKLYFQNKTGRLSKVGINETTQDYIPISMGESALFERQMPFQSLKNVLYERLDEFMFAFKDYKLTKYSLMTIIGGFILECNLLTKKWELLYNISFGTPTLIEIENETGDDKLNFIDIYGEKEEENFYPISSLLQSPINPDINVQLAKNSEGEIMIYTFFSGKKIKQQTRIKTDSEVHQFGLTSFSNSQYVWLVADLTFHCYYLDEINDKWTLDDSLSDINLRKMRVPLPEGQYRMPLIEPFSYDKNKFLVFSTLEEISPFMYVYNVKLQQLEEDSIKLGESPLRMVSVDNTYLYTVALLPTSHSAILVVYDFSYCQHPADFQKVKYPVSALYGTCAAIDFSQIDKKIVLRSSCSEIKILPVMHRNTLEIMGFPDQTNLCGLRVKDDQVVARSWQRKQEEKITFLTQIWDRNTGHLFHFAYKDEKYQNFVDKLIEIPFNIENWNNNFKIIKRKMMLLSEFEEKNDFNNNHYLVRMDKNACIKGEVLLPKKMNLHDKIFIKIYKSSEESEEGEVIGKLYFRAKGYTQFSYFSLYHEKKGAMGFRMDINQQEDLNFEDDYNPDNESPNGKIYIDLKNQKIDLIQSGKTYSLPRWICRSLESHNEVGTGMIDYQRLYQIEWKTDTIFRIVTLETGLRRNIQIFIHNFEDDKPQKPNKCECCRNCFERCLRKVPFLYKRLYSTIKQEVYFFQQSFNMPDKNFEQLREITKQMKRIPQHIETTLRLHETCRQIHYEASKSYDEEFKTDTQRLAEKQRNLNPEYHPKQKENKKESKFEEIYDQQMLDIIKEKDQILQKRKLSINKPYAIHDIVAFSNYVSNKSQLSDLSPEVLQRICLMIFPNGKTPLTLLLTSLGSMYELMQKAMNSRSSLEKDFKIPLLPSRDKKTIIDFLASEQKSDETRDMEDILKLLASNTIAQHMKYISPILIRLVKTSLESLPKFLDSCVVPVEDNRGQIEAQLSLLSTGVFCSKVQIEYDQLKQELAYEIEQQLSAKQEDEIQLQQKSMKLYYIDIPLKYIWSKQGQKRRILTEEFFSALGSSDNFELFKSVVVQKIIDFHYYRVRRQVVIYLLLPYIAYLQVFMYYAFWVVGTGKIGQDRDYYALENKNCTIFLVLFSLYFISHEVRQVFSVSEKKRYFLDASNIVDWLPPICVIATQILDYQQLRDIFFFKNKFVGMLSFSIFVVWMRCLYFMRLYPKFADLINLIQRVLVDILPFLGVMTITIFACGHAYLVISYANEEGRINDQGNESRFLQTGVDAIIYVYAMCLGDFDLDNMGSELLFITQILFTTCTIFNMIIMFNLLISIISASFENVMQFQFEAQMQEKASVIAENYHLIPKDHLTDCLESDYLVFFERASQKAKEDKSLHSKMKKEEEQVRDIEELKRYFKQVTIKSEERIMAMVRELFQQKFHDLENLKNRFGDQVQNRRDSEMKNRMKRKTSFVGFQHIQVEHLETGRGQIKVDYNLKHQKSSVLQQRKKNQQKLFEGKRNNELVQGKSQAVYTLISKQSAQSQEDSEGEEAKKKEMSESISFAEEEIDTLRSKNDQSGVNLGLLHQYTKAGKGEQKRKFSQNSLDDMQSKISEREKGAKIGNQEQFESRSSFNSRD